MSLRVLTTQSRYCQDCGEPLPKMAARLFKQNEGCCPRCAFLHRDVGISYDQVEIRNMALRGQSTIAVPRVQFHQPGRQPANAIPA